PILRIALLIDHREHNRGKTTPIGIGVTMRCKMNITVLAQLSARGNGSVCTKVHGLEVCPRRCDGQNLVSLLPGEWQASNRKLSTRTTREVFDYPCVLFRDR